MDPAAPAIPATEVAAEAPAACVSSPAPVALDAAPIPGTLPDASPQLCPRPSCEDADGTYCKSVGAICYLGVNCIQKQCACTNNVNYCP